MFGEWFDLIWSYAEVLIGEMALSLTGYGVVCLMLCVCSQAIEISLAHIAVSKQNAAMEPLHENTVARLIERAIKLDR